MKNYENAHEKPMLKTNMQTNTEQQLKWSRTGNPSSLKHMLKAITKLFLKRFENNAPRTLGDAKGSPSWGYGGGWSVISIYYTLIP